MDVINNSPRPGIKALIQHIKKQTLNITDVVFTVAPRINAAGRIKHGDYAVQLLTEFDLEQAIEFASEIEQFNSDRKELDKQITKEAIQQIIKNKEEECYTTVVYDENWHKGVIGIVASRLVENYYRPTIVFTKSGDKLAASARSVLNFDIYNALETCSKHLEQFGGHMYAAGMTLKEENYLLFKDEFEKTVKKSILPDQLTPEITIDLEINFNDITPKTLRILKQFEPFGPQNMHPIFMTKNCHDTGFAKKIGSEGEHLKLFIKQKGYEKGIGAIGFNLGKDFPLVNQNQNFQIAYSIEENEWNDQVTTQLNIKSIKKNES